MSEEKTFPGYITECGVPVQFCVNSTWSWEIAGEKDYDKPLSSFAASVIYWHGGNEVILGMCKQPCGAALHIGPESTLSDGLKEHCVYCKVLKSKEYNGSFRKEHGEYHIAYRSWVFHRFLETGVLNCGCIHEDENGKPVIRYEADRCSTFQQHGCEHEICFITKKNRNLALVNVLADIKYQTGEGFIESEVIEKGIKLWGPLVKDIADRKLKEKLRQYKRWPESWQYEHGRKLHGCIPFRVYTARGSGKDLKQDLADIAEGYEVIHTSDLQKAAASQKRERKAKRQQTKVRRQEKKNIQNWLAWLWDDNTSETLKRHAETELSKRNINYSAAVENQRTEQISLIM